MGGEDEAEAEAEVEVEADAEAEGELEAQEVAHEEADVEVDLDEDVDWEAEVDPAMDLGVGEFEPDEHGAYPGGPQDPSLLVDYQHHIARHIWAGRVRFVV